MPKMPNIFNNTAFSLSELSDAIQNIPFVPGRIGELGLFSSTSVSTTSVIIEEKGGLLSLVAPSPRGGPGQSVQKKGRNMRSLVIPHFQIDDTIMADEVQGVRAFGTTSELETVMGKVAEQMKVYVNSFAATEEHTRLGAIMGIVTYEDGSSIDLFKEFDVKSADPVSFKLSTTGSSGALRQLCAKIIRSMAGRLDGIQMRDIHAFCGDDFYDALINHPEVRETYLNWQAAEELRRPYVSVGSSFGAFNFGGITFENYRGMVNGKPFIDAKSCHLFPKGVPGLFRTAYGPADYNETVNTLGERLYMKIFTLPNDKGTNVEVQSNALQYCTRPGVLQRGVM